MAVSTCTPGALEKALRLWGQFGSIYIETGSQTNKEVFIKKKKIKKKKKVIYVSKNDFKGH